MKLTYIFHSGFVVEAQSCVLVFDYWMDPADCLIEILSKGKPVYVLVSHFHEDHFSREIFSWRKRYPHTSFTYILSKDIIRHHRCQKDEADVLMVKGNSWCDKNIKVVAAGSNDSGVSWIVEVEGKRIFHAGDLNNWYARFLTSDYEKSKHFYTDVLGMKIMTENYRKERDSWKADCWLDDNYVIELFSFPNPPARPSYPEAAGLRHLAFEVDDLSEAIDELDNKGIAHEPIRTDEYTGKRFVFFSEPDGLPIELYEK